MDFEYPDQESTRRVLEVFFEDLKRGGKPKTDQRGFYVEWMRYRNISPGEVCSYIFPVFLRYLLAGFSLRPEEENYLQESLRILVVEIEADAKEASTPPWKPYIGRENLGSLSCGFLLQTAEASNLASRIAGGFHQMVVLRRNLGIERERLWDSSVDRTTSFIDSLFLYWEGILEVKNRGGDILDLLPVVVNEIEAEWVGTHHDNAQRKSHTTA
jgi:hypothetical protein